MVGPGRAVRGGQAEAAFPVRHTTSGCAGSGWIGQRQDERLAQRGLEGGDLIVNVLDSTNLERNLFLTLQLMELGIPMILALNMWDDAGHRGIEIDPAKLEELARELGETRTAIEDRAILQI